MNQAVSGTLQPGAKENVAYLTNTERRYNTFGFVIWLLHRLFRCWKLIDQLMLSL